MHRIHTIMLVSLILLCSLIRSGLAQTPAANVTPWNGLEGTRMPNAYQSIIGDTGTTLVPESDTASALGLNLPILLPFDIDLFGAKFTAGSTVYVGIGGYLCFNSGASKAVSHYLLNPDPQYRWVVAPYWSDLRATGAPYQGIFKSYHVTPSGDSTWTIEWSVETIELPRESGRFQLVIIKHPASATYPIAWSEINFHYDPSSSLQRAVPPGFGAQIGLKRVGQPAGAPPPPTANADSLWYLLMLPETFTSGATITRLPTQGSTNTPDWLASATSPASSYFHYEMPDSSCKLKPVDTDGEITLGMPPIDEFGYGFVLLTGEAMAIPVTVSNVGLQTLIDVPVQMDIYSGTVRVDGDTATIDTLYPGDTITIECTVDDLSPGSYRVVAFIDAAGDLNHRNDSASRHLIVREQTDIMPFTLDQPILGSHTPRAEVGMPVQITGTVAGTGTQQASTIYYGYTVRDEEGTLVTSGSESSSTLIPSPEATLNIPFGNWTPTAPGRYTISINASAQGDDIPSNDALAGIPSVNWFVHGGLSAPLVAPKVPFEVYYPHDFAAGPTGRYPFLPLPGDTVRDSTRVLATFLNNGASDEPSVTARVVIENSGGTPVYNQTVQLSDFHGGGGIRTVVFPTFHPSADGSYWASAWIEHTVLDGTTANDSVRWRFEADVEELPKPGVSRPRGTGWRVAPNPASDLVDVIVEDAISGGIRVVLVDLLGTPVRSEAIEGDTPTSLRIDLAGLPSGLYTIRLEGGDGTRSAIPLVVRR